MGLNIKSEEVERLAAEVAAATGESKTEAIRMALSERKQRVSLTWVRQDRRDRLQRFFDREVWSLVPVHETSLSRREWEDILGYGPEGT